MTDHYDIPTHAFLHSYLISSIHIILIDASTKYLLLWIKGLRFSFQHFTSTFPNKILLSMPQPQCVPYTAVRTQLNDLPYYTARVATWHYATCHLLYGYSCHMSLWSALTIRLKLPHVTMICPYYTARIATCHYDLPLLYG